MKRLLLVLACITVLSTTGLAQEAPANEKASLKGLKGIYVLIEDLSDEFKDSNLIKNQLKTDAELRLKKAGIHLFDRSEAIRDHAVGTLYIQSNFIRLDPPKGQFAFHLLIEINQDVSLIRDSSIHVFNARTYSVPGYTGTISEDSLRGLRNPVNDLVDVFIKDFLAANSR